MCSRERVTVHRARSSSYRPSSLSFRASARVPALLTRVLQHPAGRFLVVGTTCATIGFVLFRAVLALLPHRVGMAALAQGVSYAISMLCSFLLNRRYTFGSDAAAGPEFARFVASQLTMLALSSAVVEAEVSVLHLPPTLSWVLATGVVAVVNYLTLRRWVFRAPSVPALR